MQHRGKILLATSPKVTNKSLINAHNNKVSQRTLSTKGELSKQLKTTQSKTINTKPLQVKKSKPHALVLPDVMINEKYKQDDKLSDKPKENHEEESDEYEEESDVNEVEDPEEKKIGNKDRVTARDLTKMVKLTNLGLKDDYFSSFQPINIGKTLFPLNTPCYFTGQKGSGKTYLLASVVQYAYKQRLITRIFYIYAENIDTTLTRAIPKNKMYAIPKEIAKLFLIKLLRKKTKFTSCYNFIESFKALGNNVRLDEKVDDVPVYWDNLLDALSKNKNISLLGQMVRYAEKVIAKYSTGTQLILNSKYTYNIGKFTVNDFDMIILDDIAQFADLFGTSRNKSDLYSYFTITRQNKTTFYLTGQEVKQLPRMFREMLGAVVLLNGTNMNDIEDLKLDKTLVRTFQREFERLKNHEGILYNFNDREYEIIKK